MAREGAPNTPWGPLVVFGFDVALTPIPGRLPTIDRFFSSSFRHIPLLFIQRLRAADPVPPVALDNLRAASDHGLEIALSLAPDRHDADSLPLLWGDAVACVRDSLGDLWGRIRFIAVEMPRLTRDGPSAAQAVEAIALALEAMRGMGKPALLFGAPYLVQGVLDGIPLWLARHDGKPELRRGIVGKQFAKGVVIRGLAVNLDIFDPLALPLWQEG